jgi:ubiquitin C-terminal hydrolase
LFSALGEVDKRFKGGNQQDSGDLLRVFLDRLHIGEQRLFKQQGHPLKKQNKNTHI